MDPLIGALILLFLALSTGCLVYLHFLPTGLNPLRNAVSEYGAGRFRFWYQAMCVNQAIAAFLTAAVLATKVQSAPFTTDLSLVVLGLARLIIAKAPVTVVRGKRKTVNGTHLLMAAIIFTSAVVASASFTRHIAGNSEWLNVAKALRVFKWSILIFALATTVTVIVPRGIRYLGTAERLLYISIIGWFAVIGIHLL